MFLIFFSKNFGTFDALLAGLMFNCYSPYENINTNKAYRLFEFLIKFIVLGVIIPVARQAKDFVLVFFSNMLVFRYRKQRF